MTNKEIINVLKCYGWICEKVNYYDGGFRCSYDDNSEVELYTKTESYWNDKKACWDTRDIEHAEFYCTTYCFSPTGNKNVGHKKYSLLSAKLKQENICKWCETEIATLDIIKHDVLKKKIENIAKKEF